MNNTTKKAILVVSFGTSFHDTRKRTIDVIEQNIKDTFTDYTIYSAWTSKIIINKLLKRDGIKINTVSKAMEAMHEDGIETVIIQPTHLINGIENDIMTAEILNYQDQFKDIIFSTPLLTTTMDNELVIRAVMSENADLKSDEALVIMGHGTSHTINSVYAALDYMFKDLNYPNVFLGTVEGYPGIDSVLKLIKKYHPSKIRLIPLMLVAGDHANNDLAGDNETSWKSIFKKEGFNVEYSLKGLGEYEGIRKIYLYHLKEAMSDVQ